MTPDMSSLDWQGRIAGLEAKLAEAQEEIKGYDEDLFTVNRRAEAAEALAERERARADDHDSARQSEKERADYAEAKLVESERMHDEVRVICAEAGVHHPRVLLVKLAEARAGSEAGDLAVANLRGALFAVRERERVLREAGEGVADSAACEFKDERLSYETWQLEPGSIEALRAALRSSEGPKPTAADAPDAHSTPRTSPK